MNCALAPPLSGARRAGCLAVGRFYQSLKPLKVLTGEVASAGAVALVFEKPTDLFELTENETDKLPNLYIKLQ